MKYQIISRKYKIMVELLTKREMIICSSQMKWKKKEMGNK